MNSDLTQILNKTYTHQKLRIQNAIHKNYNNTLHDNKLDIYIDCDAPIVGRRGDSCGDAREAGTTSNRSPSWVKTNNVMIDRVIWQPDAIQVEAVVWNLMISVQTSP
jgi:hypothetical protein